uniref:Secreted protein n=1 Tax=Knipowitschia caucasica TaxID=637954 RepID=A0AAV2IT83_KNICA
MLTLLMRPRGVLAGQQAAGASAVSHVRIHSCDCGPRRGALSALHRSPKLHTHSPNERVRHDRGDQDSVKEQWTTEDLRRSQVQQEDKCMMGYQRPAPS